MEHLRPGVAGAMVRAVMALSLSRSESSLRTAPLAPKARARGEVGPWPGAESNCRHADFQSAALPTELPGRAMQQKNLADRLERWECQCLPLLAFCLPLSGP